MMQAQIQALLAAQGGGGTGTGPNAGAHMEVAKPAIFNGEAGKVGGFITACRLFLRMKLRGATVEEQIQWILSYMQGIGGCVEGERDGRNGVSRGRI